MACFGGSGWLASAMILTFVFFLVSLCVTKFLDNKAEQMREDKMEKWKYTNVQITMIDAFLRESQAKNVLEDKLK